MDTVEQGLRGIDCHTVWVETSASEVVVLPWPYSTRKSYRHLLAEAIVVEEPDAVVLDGKNLRTLGELLVDLLLNVCRRDGSRSLAVGVGREIKEQWAEGRIGQISRYHITLVAHGEADHTVRLVGNHDLARYASQPKRYGHFLLIGLVEGHNEPKDTTEYKEEQKNQKLLVEYSQQEVSDLFEGTPHILHTETSFVVCVERSDSLLPDLFLLSVRGVLHSAEHIVLINSDNHAASDLHIHLFGVRINVLHCAVDTTTRDDGGAILKRVLKLADLLLFLLLRTNHEEPHDGKDRHHHQNHGQRTSLPSLTLCGQQNGCCHFRIICY